MRTRGHGTIDHTADMGIHGWGDSIAVAFEETATAMFELMADLEGLEADRDTAVSCEGNAPEELLVEFLNNLLSLADIEDMVFTEVAVDRLERTGECWMLTARARGATRERAAGRFLTEVKAATYYGASVIESGEGRWEARCVVDL
jgi:SHS2 domain-containing protein